jgi:DMSO/TMAO reductase YedYZ molybdopterin-dependent catalytic subunit
VRTKWWAALSGLVAALCVLATAEIVALVIGPESSPFFAVGQLVIDLAPPGVKDTMIALFGTGDKIALFVILGIVVVVFAALAGILENRRRPWGTVLLVAFSFVAVLAVTTRTGATGLWAVPTVLGAIVGVIVLRLSQQRLTSWSLAAERAAKAKGAPRPPRAPIVERRQFFRFVIVTSAVAAIAGLGARAMNAGAAAVTAIRSSISLPKPATTAPPVPAGAQLDVEGISTVVTPNDEFYRIDIALQVPQVNPDDWKLHITGMVEEELEFSYADILALPLEEHTTTIACVSNEVGGGLIGNATWLGYPIRELLAKAKVKAGADMMLSSGPDGFTAGTPLETLTDPGREAILAVGMNGEPLPTEHGFPARMIVPGLYGYVSATKWITKMELTTFAHAQGYWTPRGWSEKGPIKTQSRIDVPRSGTSVKGGTVAIAGVAWAQHTGIDFVEVRVDDGPWQKATLGEAISVDTWVQWSLAWDAPAGDHEIAVRATDKSGYTQTSEEAPPAPDGATGWHTIDVSVS